MKPQWTCFPLNRIKHIPDSVKGVHRILACTALPCRSKLGAAGGVSTTAPESCLWYLVAMGGKAPNKATLLWWQEMSLGSRVHRPLRRVNLSSGACTWLSSLLRGAGA
jgi:hypothetical protein